MAAELKQKFEDAIWVAGSLFNRNKTAGSSANLSFRHGERIYISGSGTCFGTLGEDQFAVVSQNGEHLDGIVPSKELPIHQIMYQQNNLIQAVIHTHSFYSVLWSCLKHPDPFDVVPKYTPYLEMKVGRIGLVAYAPPGSAELFTAFQNRVGRSDGYLLQNHGPVIGGSSIREAFFGLEELEESLRLAYCLRGVSKEDRLLITS